MKLYFSPGACSLSPHIVAREAGLPVELVKVDLRQKKTADGSDFTAINPKGYVPALQLDDGSLLTEGPAIVQYLADRKPELGLAPQAGSIERYRLQEWLTFIGTELHKQFSPLFAPTTPEDIRKAQIEKLQKRFAYTAGQLAGRPYLMGSQFTVADAYLFVTLSWAEMMKIDLGALPVLQEYKVRVAGRAKVQEALAAEQAARAA
jgi:glutathione S-transferase